MYTLDEVEQSLEDDRLSVALYKLERFAKSQSITELENWCSYELNGYKNKPISDEEDRNIAETYRNTAVEWKDIYERPILITNPKFFFIQKIPVWFGVIELEGFESEGLAIVEPEFITLMNNISTVPVLKASVSSDQVKALFERIRRQAIRRLHDILPRVPTRKVNYPAPNFARLVSDIDLVRVLSNRWIEANLTFEAGAYLATIILLGSILEGVLLDKIEQNPAQANTSKSCPKDKTGKPLPFADWKLQALIEVAHDCGWLRKESKDFSQVVRDYRNFVHPNRERKEGITVREGTCKVIWEVISDALI